MIYLKQSKESEDFALQRAVNAADGYLYFGMTKEALEELDGVMPLEREDVSVLRMRTRVLLHQKRWADAVDLSTYGTLNYPEENEFVVQRAFALHQLQKKNEAIQVLLSAPEWIRKSGILHYNLACYEARLGDISTARQCIRAAIKLNSSFQKNARKDPDLQDL